MKYAIKFIVKYLVVTIVMSCVLVGAIMIRYQVSLDFVMNGSDAVIEGDLRRFLDLNFIGEEFLEIFPIHTKIPILGNLLGAADTMKDSIINAGDAQSALFSSMFFTLEFIVFFKLFIWAYSFLKKCWGNDGGGFGLIDFAINVMCMLQIVYIGMITVILLHERFMINYQSNASYVTYIAIIVAIFIGAFVSSVIRYRKDRGQILSATGKAIMGTLIDLLGSAMLFLAAVFMSIADTGEVGVGTFGMITSGTMAVILYLATIVFIAYKSAKEYKTR